MRILTTLLLAMMSLSLMAQEIKTIDAYTSGMKQEKGFVTLFYDDQSNKVFLQISEFDIPFLFQSSLPQGIGSNDIGLDRGQLGDTRLVVFQRFGNKVLLKQLNTQYRATSANVAEQASIDEAFADSVLAGLPVVAQSADRVLVDYTDFLLSDIHNIAERLAQRKQGNYTVDVSRSGVYPMRTKAFVDNTELEALVTFAGTKPGEYVKQVTPAPKSISVHLHHSLIRLPDDNYQPREFHPYSGFWEVSYQDYSVPIDEEMEQAFIPRHRLAKKDPLALVSEAVEPIVYYLDPGIPEPIQSALRDGALWWDQAFAKIGYKNAFQVKILPADADPMDVRYNVIQWVHRATRGWSYGSSVIDPRTGEIIKGHVTLGSLRVRQDYLIALGLTSPFSAPGVSTERQQQMALARIRQLSAHEVGHTLGIAHNFAASENDRASVMDYPHPRLQVRNGQITLEAAYDSGMGRWDEHVIAYGYQDYTSREQEQRGLAQIIQRGRQQQLLYMSDPDARADYAANAVGHLWDNGQQPLQALNNIVEVRELALANFGVNSLREGQTLSSLQERLVPIYYLHRYQVDAVAKLVGGANYAYEVKGDFPQPRGIRPVAPEIQQRALEALMATLKADFLRLPTQLTTLVTPKAYGEQNTRESFKARTGMVFDPVSAAEASAGNTLKLLLVPERLNRLAQQHHRFGHPLSVEALLDSLLQQTVRVAIIATAGQIEQRIAMLSVDALVKLTDEAELAPEVKAKVLAALSALHQWLENHSESAMAQAMALELGWFLHAGEWKRPIAVKPMPPGSPI